MLMKQTFRAALLAAAVGAAWAAPLASGIDRAGMDPAVRPQDDLFLAMNGDWIKKTEIPADKSIWGTGTQMRDRSDAQVRTLVEELAAGAQAPGSAAQKVADFYRSYMDVGALDKAGLAPVAASLKEAEAVRDLRELVVLMGRWQGIVGLPLDVGTGADMKNPEIYAVGYGQGGLGLGDRDYYLKDDPRFAAAREAYVAYLGKLLALAGDAQSAAHAQQVFALEKKIAAAQWSREEQRDPVKAYNPKTPAELDALAPGVPWAAFAAAAQLPAGGTVIMQEPSYDTALAGLLKSEPLETWKLYLKTRRLDDCATVLPQGFRDASFELHQKTVRGLQQPAPRWQDAMHGINGALGEAVGQLYVARYFPPEARARAQQLVANLLKSYSTSIDQLTWMTPVTKQAAHDKLAKYGTKIGYPDKWRDYGPLEIRAGDALGNADRAAAFEYHRTTARIGRKVDRSEWGMTPQTVNAYYDGSMNEIVFPAAILQPPYFDAGADDAVNYGGIGAVIGHEISHGFDDEGSQYDGDGKLRDWWTEADRKAFEAITSKLVDQYHGYEPLPGHPLNGKLTLGENIADLSGLQIAFKAYKLSLGGKPSPVIDGMTGEQRFFWGYAQVWRQKTREAESLRRIVIDPHSPGRFRADGTVINNDGFHEAFGTKPGDGMWKAPADRIRLW
jgi:putative endopeptidase